jgi:hypothetical protein
VWATQQHNEPHLNEAFQSHDRVILFVVFCCCCCQFACCCCFWLLDVKLSLMGTSPPPSPPHICLPACLLASFLQVLLGQWQWAFPRLCAHDPQNHGQQRGSERCQMAFDFEWCSRQQTMGYSMIPTHAHTHTLTRTHIQPTPLSAITIINDTQTAC